MVRTTEAYIRAYQALNKEQKCAVDAIDGPVMVVAGPGTGKTQTIALRIANILIKTDTPPDAILALTFTDSAAREMRERLASFIGDTAYYVTISTFHSFCSAVIQENPDVFALGVDSKNLSDIELIKLYHELIDGHTWKLIRPVNAPYLYLKDLMKSVKDLKREGISPTAFSASLERERLLLEESLAAASLTKSQYQKELVMLERNGELLRFYELYQEKLKNLGRYDYEDMINYVTSAFESQGFLLRTYQERYLYFLVDEYQDTNSAQNAVVNLLANYWGPQANVFVVGDPSQSIYRFQGASTENMLGFHKAYPEAKVISLLENYRSTQPLLDAAYELISHNKLTIEDTLPEAKSHLKAVGGKRGKSVTVARLTSGVTENLFVVEEIKRLINGGCPPKEIAVIYRNNADALALADILTRLQVKYVIQGGGNVLEDPLIRQFLKMLSVVSKLRVLEDDLDLFTVLHYPWFGLEPLDILTLTRAAASSRRSLFEILSDKPLLSTLKLSDGGKLIAIIDLFLAWQKADATSSFTKFIETVLDESGCMSWLLRHADPAAVLGKFTALFEEIKQMNELDHELNLSKFLENLRLMESNHLKLPELHLTTSDDAIVLTTAHSAKGLEWDYVFVIKVYDTLWGNNRDRQLIKLPSHLLVHTDLAKKEKNEDERRLFYVALTRARKQVTISLAARYASSGTTKEVVPSMFLSELPVQELPDSARASFEDGAQKHLSSLLVVTRNTSSSKGEQRLLQGLVAEFRLSPTALNSYLECPHRFMLNHLLKVPRAKAPYLAFGTAMHKGLELLYRRLSEYGELPDVDYVLKVFEDALSQEVLTPLEFQERLRLGKERLVAYFNYYKSSIKPCLYTEKYFGYGTAPIYLGDIPLTGKIDRIDWIDAKRKLVRVVDYKTGKVRTRNVIEGKTKNADGSYKRQLVFYKLLIDLNPWFKATMGEAVLDFIEADAKGNFHQEAFAVTDAEVQELRSTIQEAMRRIRALDFTCTHEHSHCETCEFRDHCWPNGLPAAHVVLPSDEKVTEPLTQSS